jgi:hypothetical protein
MIAEPSAHPVLDLAADAVTLTAAVCDVPSVSGDEKPLADAVEAALRGLPHLEVLRDGDAVVARTSAGPSASSSPGTSTRCRSPTTCRPGWRTACCTGAGRST